MTRTSWLKKIWKGRSKGVSTVIGTVFLILIIFMVSTNVLLWTFSQNALYTQAVKDENQNSADMLNENIVATDGSYSVSGDKVTVEATLENIGSTAAHVINLWVFDTTIQKYGFNNTIDSLNLNLNPGDNPTVSAVVTIPEVDQSHTFNSWFVTGRGNVVSVQAVATEVETVTWSNLAEGIGSLAFNFTTFRYYDFNGSDLDNYPEGFPTFRVPHGATIAFGFELTNYSPINETITFNGHSMMWSYFPAVPGHTNGPFWYIANVNPDGSIDATYSPISLAWGESKLFVFAKQDGSWKSLQTNNLGAINLLLYGTFASGLEYAQNIPFVAIYAYT